MSVKSSKYEQLFKGQTVWRSIFMMAIPSLLTIIIMIFYNLADMFFIAQLGDTAKLASVSIIGPVFNIIMAMATMIGVGGSTVIANALGAGNMEKAKDTSSLCFYSAILLGVIVTILLFIFQRPLLALLGTKPEMRESASAMGIEYMLYVMFGAPFLGLVYISTNYLQASGKAGSAILVSLLRQGMLLIPLLYIMHGMFGFNGIAAAHTVADIGAAAIALLFFFYEYRKMLKEFS